MFKKKEKRAPHPLIDLQRNAIVLNTSDDYSNHCSQMGAVWSSNLHHQGTDYTEVFDRLGNGKINWLAFHPNLAPLRSGHAKGCSISIRIIVDGDFVVFNEEYEIDPNDFKAYILIGTKTCYQPIEFNKLFTVEVKCKSNIQMVFGAVAEIYSP